MALRMEHCPLGWEHLGLCSLSWQVSSHHGGGGVLAKSAVASPSHRLSQLLCELHPLEKTAAKCYLSPCEEKRLNKLANC